MHCARVWLFALQAIIGTATGCSYLDARARDLGDCFKVSVGAGLGVYVDAHAFVVGSGLGYWTGEEAGWYPKIGWKPTSGVSSCGFRTAISECYWIPVPLLFLPVGIAVVWLEGAEGPGPHMYLALGSLVGGGQCRTSYKRQFFWPYRDPDVGKYGMLLYVEPNPNNNWTDFFWIEAAAYVFIGIRAGFNVAEFADFLLGWFGLDLCEDDDRS